MPATRTPTILIKMLQEAKYFFSRFRSFISEPVDSSQRGQTPLPELSWADKQDIWDLMVKKETGRWSEEGSSVSVSHKSCLAQLTVLAGKHKQIAVSLGQLGSEYESHVARLTEQHRAVQVEGKRLQQEMDNNIKKLFKSHEKFERRQLESDLAENNLSKSEPDSRISRAELERVREVADEAKMRASRAREEYSLQLSLTNKHQRGFYQETWPGLYSRLRLVGREAEEGVQDLLARLVAAGRDQWPPPEEAWGELETCRELLDFKGLIIVVASWPELTERSVM